MVFIMDWHAKKLLFWTRLCFVEESIQESYNCTKVSWGGKDLYYGIWIPEVKFRTYHILYDLAQNKLCL